MLTNPKRFIVVITASLTGFIFVVLYSVSLVDKDSVPQAAQAGKQVFQRQACIECHSLFGNGGYNGGDLTSVYERLGDQQIQTYLTKPPLLTGAKKKRHPQISRQEANQVIEYLRFINSSVNTHGWPPASYK